VQADIDFGPCLGPLSPITLGTGNADNDLGNAGLANKPTSGTCENPPAAMGVCNASLLYLQSGGSFNLDSAGFNRGAENTDRQHVATTYQNNLVRRSWSAAGRENESLKQTSQASCFSSIFGACSHSL
jgi:hypothetical protein